MWNLYFSMSEPEKPEPLSAFNISAHSFSLRWSLRSGHAGGFHVDLVPDSGFVTIRDLGGGEYQVHFSLSHLSSQLVFIFGPIRKVLYETHSPWKLTPLRVFKGRGWRQKHRCEIDEFKFQHRVDCYLSNVYALFFFFLKSTLNLQPAIQGFMNSLTKRGQSYWVIQAH